MTTILVVSDNHFQEKELLNILKKYPKIEYYVHCGDSQWLPDDVRLQQFITVRGNNDVSGFANHQIFKTDGYTILATHGHQQYVMNYGKDNLQGTEDLVTYAQQQHADIVLYGHTHVPETHEDRNIIVLNPGSINFPRGFDVRQPTYAIITLDGKHVSSRFYNAQSHQDITDIIIK